MLSKVFRAFLSTVVHPIVLTSLTIAVAIMWSLSAYADNNQDAAQVVGLVCAHQDAFTWFVGIVLGSKVISWFRASIVTKMPLPLQHVVNFLALNWRQVLQDAQMVAKVCVAFTVSLALAACSLTGNPSVDLAAWGQQVSTFNQQAASAASAFNVKVVATIVPAGKAVCAAASQLDGFYHTAVGQAVVQLGTSASGGTPVDATNVNASEAATFAKVQSNCAVVDAMDPNAPTQDEIAAVQLLLQDEPQLLSDIQKVAPAAAALIAPVVQPTPVTPVPGTSA